jgi:hypothetical protein
MWLTSGFILTTVLGLAHGTAAVSCSQSGNFDFVCTLLRQRRLVNLDLPCHPGHRRRWNRGPCSSDQAEPILTQGLHIGDRSWA